MTDPSVSVVIPCADMARFLGDAVASILCQDVAVGEIIVVRPERDTETIERCEALAGEGAPLVQMPVEEPGPAAARNVGIAAAKGEMLAFLDADDLWFPDKLKKQLDRIGREPSVDIVGGLSIFFDRLDRETLAPSAASRTRRQLWINMGAFIVRRRVFEDLGPFDPAYYYAEDVDFLLRARDAGFAMAVLKQPVLYYRQHRGSMMQADDRRKVSDLRKAMLASVLRRRKLGLAPETEQFLVGQLEPPPTSDEEWRGFP